MPSTDPIMGGRTSPSKGMKVLVNPKVGRGGLQLSSAEQIEGENERWSAS